MKIWGFYLILGSMFLFFSSYWNHPIWQTAWIIYICSMILLPAKDTKLALGGAKIGFVGIIVIWAFVWLLGKLFSTETISIISGGVVIMFGTYLLIRGDNMNW
jgi:hypothetical protein